MRWDRSSAAWGSGRPDDRARFLAKVAWSRPSWSHLRAYALRWAGPTFAPRASVGRPTRAGLPHEQWPEPPLGFVGVVRRAAQLEVVDGRRPAIGERNAVVVLKPGCLGATAFGPDECASIAVACTDRASHCAGTWREPGSEARASRGRSVRPYFTFSSCSTSTVNARSMTAASSALRFVCRSRSCARRSFVRVSAPIVTCSL